MNLTWISVPTLTSRTIIIRTLIIISRNNWLFLWGAIELNLLRFIPLIITNKQHKETDAAIKYFLAQALASAILLTFSISLWTPIFQLEPYIHYLLITALLIKIGRVPCHFWYTSVIASINWIPCLILSSWQKLGPLTTLLFFCWNKDKIFISVIARLNALIGGVMGINQRQLRAIMAYSSITHIGWIISIFPINLPITSIIYFLIYCSVIRPLFIIFNFKNVASTKQMATIRIIDKKAFSSVTILILALGGLPPLTGFLPKLIITLLLSQHRKSLIIILIIGSIINLFFYLSIIINRIINTPQNPPTTKKTNSINTIIISSRIISMWTIPIIIYYAMTIFNKPQRYWHTILHFRNMSWNNRYWNKNNYPNRTKTARHIYREGSTLQHNCNSTRISYNLLPGYTSFYWGIRKLTPTTNTWCSWHSIPST